MTNKLGNINHHNNGIINKIKSPTHNITSKADTKISSSDNETSIDILSTQNKKLKKNLSKIKEINNSNKNKDKNYEKLKNYQKEKDKDKETEKEHSKINKFKFVAQSKIN